MSLITWGAEFTLGISEIDEQHQKMVAIINKLHDFFENKHHEEQAKINQVIKEMADYAIYHFQTEEKYFELFGYEKASAHIEIHNQYRAKIEDWRQRYETTPDKSIYFEISSFLQDWWTWHINNTDREYVPFFKANKIN